MKEKVLRVAIGLLVLCALVLAVVYITGRGPFAPAPTPTPMVEPTPTVTPTPSPDYTLRVIPLGEAEKRQLRLPDPLWGRADIFYYPDQRYEDVEGVFGSHCSIVSLPTEQFNKVGEIHQLVVPNCLVPGKVVRPLELEEGKVVEIQTAYTRISELSGLTEIWWVLDEVTCPTYPSWSVPVEVEEGTVVTVTVQYLGRSQDYSPSDATYHGDGVSWPFRIMLPNFGVNLAYVGDGVVQVGWLEWTYPYDYDYPDLEPAYFPVGRISISLEDGKSSIFDLSFQDGFLYALKH